MSSKTEYLERIFVSSPCKMNWENMTGTDQVRHCAECNRHVFDLSKMTRWQAEHLITVNQGRICARITRTQAGAIITLEESPTLHLITRRTSPIAAAVVSAAIIVGSAAPALAVSTGGQAQISSVSTSNDTKSSASGTSSKPIAVEPADPQVLGDPIAPRVHSGVVAMVPLTLHHLYEKSDLILVGIAGRTSSKESDAQVLTSYHAVAFLKGKPRKQTISVIHYGQTDDNFAEGKTALLFLSKGSSENGASRRSYVLADFSAGVKTLPQADIDTDTARLQELAAIEQRKHDADDIVEWLVRCAEDPATRWEGTYELASEPADSVDGAHSETPKPVSLGTSDNVGNSQQPRNPDAIPLKIESIQMRDDSSTVDEQDSPDNKLASRLTEAHRERLVISLLSTQSTTPGDLKLIEIAKTWKDPRAIDFLIERLHGIEDNPPSIADELVEHLSDMIDDEEISKLAGEFGDAPSAPDVSHQSEDLKDQAQDEAGDKAEQAAKVREANEKRSAALKKFLAAVESRRRRRTVQTP